MTVSLHPWSHQLAAAAAFLQKTVMNIYVAQDVFQCISTNLLETLHFAAASSLPAGIRFGTTF